MNIMKMLRGLLKNKDMSETKELKEQVFYVWAKTERAGAVVAVDNTQPDAKWLNFTDGTRINATLVDEMLMLADSESHANTISKDLGGLGIPSSTTEVVDAIPVETTTVERRITDGKSAPTPEVNIMMEMLTKMSKKNTAEMVVNINIPSLIVYDMLKDQMDLEPKDLNEQIELLVENQINNLQIQLKEQINKFITNYYTDARTTKKNS